MLQNRPGLPFNRQLFDVYAGFDNKQTLGLEDLLPAVYRGGDELRDLEVPQLSLDYYEDEFNLDRLGKIYGYLWLAGRPMPPRALHYQLGASREIVISEQMDMHLVWKLNRIYLKPVPRYLLDYDFWKDHLVCQPNCDGCSGQEQSTAQLPQERAKERIARRRCARRRMRGVALGFLLSYAGLVRYESDLQIAHEKHLLPDFVDWVVWRRLVKELLLESRKNRDDVDERFQFGELRLSRLNKIYFFRFLALRGYRFELATYGVYFQRNLAPIASFIVYIAVVLTAMQVGLATERLASNKAFQDASYGFTVFSIVAPLGLIAAVGLSFLFLFVFNFVSTVRFKKGRLGAYGDATKANV